MTPLPQSLAFALVQAASTLLFTPIALASTALPSLPRARVIALWARFNLWALRHICGIRYQVQGADNLPTGPAVLIANHQSAWETLCFQLIFPPQSYIIKSQLLWIPFFGWGLAANRPVAVNRTQKRQALSQLLTRGAARLAEGRWLVIFPEGTRMPPGSPGPFQAGAAMLAAQNNVPVVPVAHNAGLHWPKNSLIKHPGTIQVQIGKPINPQTLTPRQINTQAQDWIHKTLKTMPQSRV